MSSIDNPKVFDYLKVVEWSRNTTDKRYNYTNVYPLTCVTRNSVEIHYKDNAEYSISFDVFNDGSAGFEALHENSRIVAGDQIFVIQNYTKKVSGVATASVTATQLVNADFPRVQQPRLYRYKDRNTDDGTTNSENISYVTLHQLLRWFFHRIDAMGFRYRIHGYFPQRPIKNIGHWNGKQLITQVVKTWPGTVVIGWGHTIHFYGYQQTKDANGNPLSVRDIDTGQRIDAMLDTKVLNISRDTTKMCNAIEVKAATHSVEQQNNNDSGDDDGTSVEEENEVVYHDLPFFPNFLAISERSIRKYGLYTAQDVLDEGFTDKGAAMAAAREKMVTDPVVSVTAQVDHAGLTETQPIPGHRYTVGVSQEGELYHVILRGFTWYPFDPTKGVTLTMDNVDPGIIGNLRTIIIHDAELSPTITQFKALEDNSSDDSSAADGDYADDDYDYSDAADDASEVDDDDDETDPVDDMSQDSDDDPSGEDQGDGDDTGQTANTDQQKDRPNDDGHPGHRKTPKSFKAFLPISDKGAHAHISRYGNVTINRDNPTGYTIRVGSTKVLEHLRDGNFTDEDKKNNFGFKNLMRIMPHDYTDANTGANFYNAGSFYFGQGAYFSDSGGFFQVPKVLTIRGGVSNEDYKNNGEMHHSFHRVYGDKPKKGGLHHDGKRPYTDYFNDASNSNPGVLATVQAGKFVGHSFAHYSQLSKKKDVKRLSTKYALNKIDKAELGTFKYKDDPDEEVQASMMIDDVHDTPHWVTPDDFMTKDHKHINDTKLSAYQTAAIQELHKLLKKQDQRIDAQDKLIKKQGEAIKALEEKVARLEKDSQSSSQQDK